MAKIFYNLKQNKATSSPPPSPYKLHYPIQKNGEQASHARSRLYYQSRIILLCLFYQQTFGLENVGGISVEGVYLLEKTIHLLDKRLQIGLLKQALAVIVVLKIMNKITKLILGIGDAIEDEKQIAMGLLLNKLVSL